MPNVVKYSTTSENNAIKKGNIAIGVNSVDYGGGGQSGWWNTIDVPTGGYVVYANKASNGPSIMVPPDDTALVGVARSFGASSSVTTAAGALNYFASQSDMMVVNKNYNNIVTSGLVLNVDASFVASYPVSGTSWYDISGSGNTGTLVNGPTFNTNGWIQFDGTNDQVNIANNTSLQITGNQTLEFIVYPERRDRRQNWYNKSYGGEGTITYETGGTMSYYYGTAGSDNQPYQGVGSAAPSLATLNRWYHVVLVRELSTPTKTVKWYINGSLNATSTASYTAATASTNQITLGNGYTNPFLGRLPVTRQYNIALSSSQVLQNYYGGPIVTSGLTFVVDAGNLVSFQNGSGSTFSLVGSYTGTLQNGVSYTIGGGGSWVFDGVDDYVNVSNGSFGYSPGTTGELSLEVWINPTGPFTSYIAEPPITNLAGVFGQGYLNNAVGWGLGIVVITGVGNCFSFQVRNLSNNVSVGANLASGYATFTTNQWYHLVGTFTRNDLSRLYVNGILKSYSSSVSLNNVSITPSLTDAALSRAGSTGQFYTGCNIGIARLYTRALSASEIHQNFNGHRNRFGL